MSTPSFMVDIPQRNSFSYSEIDTWSQCRQKWWWTYALNLQSRKTNLAPRIGSAGHAAIASLFEHGTWETGLEQWQTQAVSDLDPEDDAITLDETSEIGDLVAEIMPRYLEAYPYDFKPVVVEHEFRVRIPGFRRTLDGYFDAIVQDDDGGLWLKECKWVKSTFRTREQMELDAQIGLYHYAAIRAGFKIKGVIYDQVLAKPCKRPVLTQKRTMSKADIRCDWKTYREELIIQGLDPCDYEDMKEKLADKKFFQRDFLIRSDAEIINFVYDVQPKLRDMSRRRNYIYLSENRFHCVQCNFRELCLAKLKGHNLDEVIKASFEPRQPRSKTSRIVEYEEEEEVADNNIFA